MPRAGGGFRTPSHKTPLSPQLIYFYIHHDQRWCRWVPPLTTRDHTRENSLRSPPWIPLDLRIRSKGLPAMPGPIQTPQNHSDSHDVQFLMILVWPWNLFFLYFCAPGRVEVYGRLHVESSHAEIPGNLCRRISTLSRGECSQYLSTN